MNIAERQLESGTPSPPGQVNQVNSTAIPSYVWITIVICIALALTCGLFARRNYRRRYIYHEDQQELDTGINRPPPLPFTRVWPGGSDSSSRVIPIPTRVRRRPSQLSVTGLPVYMERPGDREVILLQNTGPKAEEAEVLPPPPSTSLHPPINANPLPTTASTDAAVPASIHATLTDAQPISQPTTAPTVPLSSSYPPPAFSSSS